MTNRANDPALAVPSYLKSKGLASSCAWLTDGRFSGGGSGLSIDHVSPEADQGGLIGLMEDGDVITIYIAGSSIQLEVDEAQFGRRSAAMTSMGSKAWTPAVERNRRVSPTLRAYAALTTSASPGAARRTRRPWRTRCPSSAR